MRAQSQRNTASLLRLFFAWAFCLFTAATQATGQLATQSAIWSDHSPSTPSSTVNLSIEITSVGLIQNDSPPATPPGGTVAFYDGGSPLGTVNVSQASVYNWLFASELIGDDLGYWSIDNETGSPFDVVQSTSMASPSGSASATQISGEGPGNTNVSQQANVGSASGTFTSSIWLKSATPASCSGLQLGVFGPDTEEGNSTSLTVSATWQRYAVTGQILIDDMVMFNLSIPAGCTVSMWGAQLENAPSMSPYQYESRDGFYANTVSTATFSTSSLSTGVHPITAIYSGDSSGNLGSTASFTQYVGVTGTPTIFDAGSVTLTVNGVSATTNYGQGSTGASIASALATAYGQIPNRPVNVDASSNGLSLTAIDAGSGTAYPYTFTVTYDTGNFSVPSYSISSASGTLTPGNTYESIPAPVYSYSIPANGYDFNGNLLSYTDSVMGSWIFGYDQLNRLTGATDTTTPNSWASNGTAYFCWSYDSFGNRTNQSTSNEPFQTGSQPCQPASNGNISINNATFNNQNQLTSSNAGGGLLTPSYDNTGDITYNGNHFLYDPDGRVCATSWAPISGGIQGIGYLYNAVGQRVAKGNITSWSCDTTTNGFTVTNQYILGPSGDQMTELTVSAATPTWMHTNIYAAGSLVATYENDNTGPHFRLTDWLGTTRAQTNYAGALEQTCQSLPFGEGPFCAITTEQFFTGKERDAESGLDYFGARYYASSMGRWMSPDWADKPEAVPYSSLDNPQSLNLYGYVNNNPLSHADPDGHECPTCDSIVNFAAGAFNAWGSDNLAGAGRVDQTTSAGAAGARLGDAVAAVQGVAETVQGVGAAIAGGAEAFVTAPLAGTGVGIVVPGAGAVVAVAGAAEAVHGVATAGTAVTALMKSGGNFNQGQKQAAKDAAGGKCQNCGVETTTGQKSQKGVTPPGTQGEGDHVIPKSKGGTNGSDNIQHLCRDCNAKKGDKMPGQ